MAITPFRKKKSLGQNFLRSKSIVKRIALSANILPGEIVLEIGPGKGILTRALLDAGAHVIAVEKDDRLIPELEELFRIEAQKGLFTLVHGDILELFPASIPFIANGTYKVVANIPYYISGALLRLLLESDAQPNTMVLMLQKEVARRIVAQDKKESILSVSVKAYGIPKYIDTVKKEMFKPVPNVDSAILQIHHISKDFFVNTEEKTFFKIIKTAFGQKRKTLGNTLRAVFAEKTSHILSNAGVESNARPEDLTLTDWKKILTSADTTRI